MKKIFLVSFAVIALTGCVSPGTYTNKSTPDGIVIEATGMAAVEAARSNPSFNCPTCQASNSIQQERQYAPAQKTGYDHRQELRDIGRNRQYQRPSIAQSVRDDFHREFRYNATRKARKEISRIMDKIF